MTAVRPPQGIPTEQPLRRLTAADFAACPPQTHAPQLARPSLSYWQDVWLRLRRNGRAVGSLAIILLLLAFASIGPLLWRVDPTAQDLDQISQPPGADRTARLVAPWTPWRLAATGANVQAACSMTGPGLISGAETMPLALAGPATTQAVRLCWNALPDASTYRVYRNLWPAEADQALGLPLADIPAGASRRYEDRLDLQPGTWHYTIQGLAADGSPLGFMTLPVTIERVITPAEAASRGLLTAGSDASEGTLLELAWHPLGTDYLGRDMLARLMHGARVSLFIGLFTPLLYVLLGVVYGSVAGFIGGRTDAFMMRGADFVVALPFLLFMILFKIGFGIGPGESGIVPMIVAMIALSWPSTSRLVRGQILQIREEGYIGASRLLGASTPWLIARHMLPNTLGVVLVTLTFAVPGAIFTEAFLSFIGMGVAPPTPSWGSMCNEGIKTMLTHPHELVFPALLISVTVLAFNLLGDGLRDALDARMRGRE